MRIYFRLHGTQVVTDGRTSNTAQIAASYASSIITEGLQIISRSWFNSNLETRNNVMSRLIAVLAVVQVTLLAGHSVAREREQGTFDQLLVTSVSSILEILQNITLVNPVR